jgi:hypothetical protein
MIGIAIILSLSAFESLRDRYATEGRRNVSPQGATSASLCWRGHAPRVSVSVPSPKRSSLAEIGISSARSPKSAREGACVPRHAGEPVRLAPEPTINPQPSTISLHP